MTEIRLRFPLEDLEALRPLRAGQKVVIDGHIVGIRDATHIRIFDHGVAPPIDLTGAALLHTAPGVRKLADGSYEKVCIGTTTSLRMDRFTQALLRDYGARAIIGKAGLLPGSIHFLREYGGCYLALTGGAAALETAQIEAIEEVYWEDLMPECLWKFRVKEFGPLIVAMDSHGESLYREVKEEAQARLDRLMADL